MISTTYEKTNRVFYDTSKGLSNRVLITVLIDTSGSMRHFGKIEAAQQAYQNLIAMLRPTDEIALYFFNDDLKKVHDYLPVSSTHNLAEISTNGGTALFDSMFRTIEEMPYDNRAYADVVGRFMIVLTDGDDNSEISSRELRKEQLTYKVSRPGRKNFNLYLIGIGIEPKDAIVLESICKCEHAHYFPCENNGVALQMAFKRVQDTIRRIIIEETTKVQCAVVQQPEILQQQQLLQFHVQEQEQLQPIQKHKPLQIQYLNIPRDKQPRDKQPRDKQPRETTSGKQPQNKQPRDKQPRVNNHGINNHGINNHGINNPGINNPGINNHGINNHGINNYGKNNYGINNYGINNPGINNHGINNYGINNHGINNHGINNHGINNYGINNSGINNPGINNHGINNYGINNHYGKQLRYTTPLPSPHQQQQQQLQSAEDPNRTLFCWNSYSFIKMEGHPNIPKPYP